MSIRYGEIEKTPWNGPSSLPISGELDRTPLRQHMKDEISVVIRKTRAQTLWDAFAREMTHAATKTLSFINPNSVAVEPTLRIYSRGGVSLASPTLKSQTESPWGYNQQLDFILRILQDGLYCVKPELIKQIVKDINTQLPDGESPSVAIINERFSLLCKTLQEQAPFKLAQSVYDKIEQIIPEPFAYDDNNTDDKGDRRRLFKLSRILFFLRYYQDSSENEQSFAEFFITETDRVLSGFKKGADYSPQTQEEHVELFKRLNKHFDNTIIEQLFDRAIHKYCPRSANQISFQKKTSLPKKTAVSEEDSLFIKDDRHFPELLKLAMELRSDHYSLVGGRDYTRMRFPEAILKRIALGAIKAVIVDGTLDEALEYVKDTYMDGANDILQFQVCGQYGDFSKVYLRYQLNDKIEQLFLVAQPGQSRVLSNAAALLNYAGKKDSAGKLLPAPVYIGMEQIECVYRKTPLNKIIRAEIQNLLDAISEEAKILGKEQFAIPTVLMPATSGDTIIQSLDQLGLVEQRTDHRFETTGKVSVIILNDPITSQKRRVIIPSVGGAGLYGDTAGIFVDEFLTFAASNPSELKLSGHIKFFATAGAITNPSFHPHEGQLCSPQGDFISYDFQQQVASPKVEFSHKSITKYLHHGWAPCPAVETSAFFADLEQNKDKPLGMIDVEGLFIAKAIQGRGTFTPLYYVSDLIKPKKAGFNKHQPDFDSYAYGCRAGMAIRLSKSQTKALFKYIFAE